MGIIQQGIYFNYDWGSGKNWPFQTMQNLGADLFSGYVHDFNPFNEGKNNSTYYMMDGWNGSTWDNTYGYIMPEVQKSETINEKDNIGFFGITKILKVELMHRLSDLYGPIVYTQFDQKRVLHPIRNKKHTKLSSMTWIQVLPRYVNIRKPIRTLKVLQNSIS